MGWGGAGSPGGGADSSPDAPGGGLGEGAFGGEGPSVSGAAAQPGSGWDSASMEAFREAISKALGAVNAGKEAAKEATAREVQREVERQALAQEIKDFREREAIAMGATLDQSPLGTQGIDVGSQVDSFTDYGKMDESQFDDPKDNSPISAKDRSITQGKTHGPISFGPPGYGSFDQEEAGTIDPGFNFQDRGYEPNMEVDAGIGITGLGAPSPAEIDTSPTDYGTMATEEFDSPLTDYDKGVIASQEMDDDPWGGTKGRKERNAAALTLARAIEVEQDRINKMDIMSTERGKLQRQLDAIKDTDLFSKAYNFANPSALRGLAAQVMGSLGMKALYGIAKSIESKAIDAGMFDDRTFADLMGQLQDPAAFGAMGNPLGTGGADQNKEVMKKIINNVEPWTKGLTLTQVQYYFDRPEELEWVRNLWNSMNPAAAV